MYTPGPWKMVPTTESDRWYIMASDGSLVAQSVATANARLIALAPELHERLSDKVAAAAENAPMRDVRLVVAADGRGGAILRGSVLRD